MRDLKMMLIVGWLGGCGGESSNDTDGAATTGEPTGASTGTTNEPTGASTGTTDEPTGASTGTTNEPTAASTATTDEPTGADTGSTTEPLPPPGGPVKVCATTPGLYVDDAFGNATIAVDPAGTHLYVTVRDQAYRWSIGGGDDCGLTLDPSFTPSLDGEVDDLAVTAAGEVYVSIEYNTYSPEQVWPQAEAKPCLLGPDDPLGGHSIAVGGDGTGLFVGYNDAEYHTQLYRAAPDLEGCTLQLQWTESEQTDDGFNNFVLDADGRMHVMGRDDETNHDVIVVHDTTGAVVNSYKGPTSLCTASTVARCGPDICVMSCWNMLRFSSAGVLLQDVDLSEPFDFSGEYIGVAGAPDGTVYVLRVGASEGPDGYPLIVLRLDE